MDLLPPPDRALDPASSRVRDYLSQAKAHNTLRARALDPVPRRFRASLPRAKPHNPPRAYAADWRHFQDWCRSIGHAWLPAEPVAVSFYLAELAETARVSTLTRRLSAISQAHQ